MKYVNQNGKLFPLLESGKGVEVLKSKGDNAPNNKQSLSFESSTKSPIRLYSDEGKGESKKEILVNLIITEVLISIFVSSFYSLIFTEERFSHIPLIAHFFTFLIALLFQEYFMFKLSGKHRFIFSSQFIFNWFLCGAVVSLYWGASTVDLFFNIMLSGHIILPLLSSVYILMGIYSCALLKK